MTDLADVDYFSDAGTAQNPYAYWEHLRSLGPFARNRTTGSSPSPDTRRCTRPSRTSSRSPP